MVPSRIHFHCAMVGTPNEGNFMEINEMERNGVEWNGGKKNPKWNGEEMVGMK